MNLYAFLNFVFILLERQQGRGTGRQTKGNLSAVGSLPKRTQLPGLGARKLKLALSCIRQGANYLSRHCSVPGARWQEAAAIRTRAGLEPRPSDIAYRCRKPHHDCCVRHLAPSAFSLPS